MTTTPPAVFGQFGMALAFAERTLTEILHQHLAERGTKPETWYALQLIATRGPGLPREALVRDLERSRNADSDSIAPLLAGLAADGLIRGGSEINLTPQGEAFHHGLREYVAGPTVRLLSQFDIHDIETTVSTLRAVTKIAAEESAASGQMK